MRCSAATRVQWWRGGARRRRPNSDGMAATVAVDGVGGCASECEIRISENLPRCAVRIIVGPRHSHEPAVHLAMRAARALFDGVRERGRVPEAIWARVTGGGLHEKVGHPLCTLRKAIAQYFERYAPGEFNFYNRLPPVVSVEQCFDALLVPPHHASRSATDTYYVDDTRVLRAHMTAHDVPLLRQGERAFVNCGHVFRRDTVDRTHYPVFHQMDGLRLFAKDTPKDVVIDDLRGALEGLAEHLFAGARTRWVDAYFPFTSPSFELEVQWRGQWLEVLGCGMVERSVLDNGRVDAGECGWAFGLGLERLAMVLFGIPDIRLFWSGDHRFLEQFRDADLSTKYAPFSAYPAVKKDVSLWVNEPLRFHVNDVHEVARLVAADLVESVQVVDRFSKQGRQSLCFRMTFRSMEKNLEHAQVNELVEDIRSRIAQSLPVDLR